MDVCNDGAAQARGIGRSLIRSLALAILIVGPAWAQNGSDVDSRSSGAEPRKINPPDPAWTALEREFSAAWQAQQVAIQRAQQQSVEQAKWPASPVNDFWERCTAFADRGEVGAIRWCIAYLEGLALSPAARNQRRHELYRGWAKNLPEGPGLKEVLRSVQLEANPNRLGIASVGALLAEIADRVQDRTLRGEARVARGILLLGAGGPESLKRARESIALGIQDDPQGESVSRARGRLFQLDHLQIGMACPDFTALDVDGVEFKRSDYLGKVVVLDFWGFW